jgi:inner membrane protein
MAMVTGRMRGSQTVRLLWIAALALLLQIPILLINGVVSERQIRYAQVVREVSDKWGKTQVITGPALIVPYTHSWTEVQNSKQVNQSETRHAVFLPEQLKIEGNTDVEVRKRGIYSVPVYELTVIITGEFERPNFADLGVQPAAIAWDKAYLAVGISDARAIQTAAQLTWDNRQVSFLPGPGAFDVATGGIHAVVGISPSTDRISFSFPMQMNGSSALFFTPFGKTTVVDLQSNYPHPSFQGNWLPTERTVEGQGFSAQWSIPFYGRNYPQAWLAQTKMSGLVNDSRFGVELVSQVDHYRMTERSVKYAFFFIVLTFATVWLFEVLAKIRVHPIQYLLLGAALCLFYLLELSLSEHIGFVLAYILATSAVVAMVATYGKVALRSTQRGLFMGGGVALLYVYLFVLLDNEDYALLIGSLGLFVILALIMYVTRRVDWYALGTEDA